MISSEKRGEKREQRPESAETTLSALDLLLKAVGGHRREFIWKMTSKFTSENSFRTRDNLHMGQYLRIRN